MLFLLFLALKLALAAQQWDDSYVPIDPHKDSIYNYNTKDSQSGLEEFTPIKSTITQSQTQYYSFNVNTTQGLGDYYELLIFITGNICTQPDNLAEQNGGSGAGADGSYNGSAPSLAVYYSFDADMFGDLSLGKLAQFQYGYFQALAEVPIANATSAPTVLYIAVRAPQNTDTAALWLYEIGVSQNDLVYQWDNQSWASLVDADHLSALVVTGNLSGNDGGDLSEYNVTLSRYLLLIYSDEYRHYFDLLNQSWCAIRSGPALFSTTQFESLFTYRGGGLHQQFYVPNLNESSRYRAYLVADFNGGSYGGAVYEPFEFTTMSSDACKLVYDLDFCDQVAYLAPNDGNRAMSGTELGQTYDDRAQMLYQNFSKALQQIGCDESDSGIFSPYRSCKDCATRYKDWLCAVTIPRCSTTNRTTYRHVAQGDNRNDWINSEIDPLEHYEVLPCLGVCQQLLSNCPSDFGFACPDNDTSSYQWEECNWVGQAA